MKHHITQDRFIELFKIYNREHNFSNLGLKYLYNYLEDIGYEDLDVIELCCTYEEYSELAEYAEVYDDIPDPIVTLPTGGFIVLKH